MHDPRNVPAQRQQNVQPERPAKPDLQKHAQWWQQNSDDDANMGLGSNEPYKLNPWGSSCTMLNNFNAIPLGWGLAHLSHTS
jgi:hypothetical protein